jgi:UDP-N-acetylmuramate: L-alanyl-gamma-D-glutamyl-meso-diaminopimelate ligase
MRLGSMRQPLVDSLKAADAVFCYAPGQGRHALAWDAREVLAALGGAVVGDDLQDLARAVAREARAGDRVVVMSNGGFGGMPGRILDELAAGSRSAAGAARRGGGDGDGGAA